MPFVNVTVSSVSYAGYTETGGPFPATFSALTSTSAILRVGVDGRYEFEQDSYLSAGPSYGHNFGNGGTVAGAIPGAFALSVPGDTAARDFVEASIGLDLPIDDNIRFNSRLADFRTLTGRTGRPVFAAAHLVAQCRRQRQVLVGRGPEPLGCRRPLVARKVDQRQWPFWPEADVRLFGGIAENREAILAYSETERCGEFERPSH